MPFDPDKYLEEKAGKSFDPDAYLQEKTGASVPTSSPAQTPNVSQLESLLRGAVQSGTANLSDEAVGAYNSPTGALKAIGGLLGRDVSNDPDVAAYMKARDEERAKNQAAHDANPKTYIGGQLGGGLATSFIPGLNAASLEGAASLGGLSALGASNSDLAKGEVGGAAKDTAIGTGTGILASKLGDALSGVIGKSAKALQRDAGDTALGAMGIGAKEAEKELGAGRGLFAGGGEEGASIGQNAINFRKGMGQEALENLGWTGGTEGIRAKVLNKIKGIIDTKAPLIAEADQALQAQMASGNAPISAAKTLESTLDDILDKHLAKLAQTEMNPSVISNVEKYASGYIDDISRANFDFDIARLDGLKQNIGRSLQNRAFQTENTELATQDALLKDFYGAIKTRIETLADAALPQAGEQIKALNARESNLLDLSRMALKDSAKDLAKKGGGFGDFAAFGVGAHYGGPVGGIAAVAGKKILEKGTGFDVRDLLKIGIAKNEAAAAKLSGWIAGESAGSTGQKVSNIITPVAEDYMAKLSNTLYSAPKESLTYLSDKLKNGGFPAQGEALEKALSSDNTQLKNGLLFSILQDPKKRALLHKDDANGNDQ